MDVTAFIVYNGVEGGIERVSRYMMPILVLSGRDCGLCLTPAPRERFGRMRTGMEGLRYPTPHGRADHQPLLQILLDAMSAVLLPQRIHGHYDHLRFCLRRPDVMNLVELVVPLFSSPPTFRHPTETG